MREQRETSRVFDVFVASVVIAVASTACVRLDEGHCIVNGGDFACDDDRMCVAEIDAVNEFSDRGDGCIFIAGIDYALEDYFVHAKYGLPDSLRARTEDAVDDVRSVTGVLARAAEEHGVEDVEECVVSEPVVRQFEEEWREVKAIHTFLDRRNRVRVESAGLEAFQVQAIEAFNGAIDAWLGGCEELVEEG